MTKLTIEDIKKVRDSLKEIIEKTERRRAKQERVERRLQWPKTKDNEVPR
jgi:hypothetical protein